MPSLSSIVSVLVSLVLVVGNALPCPCGPDDAGDDESSCCAGMAVDDEGQPVEAAAHGGDEMPHDSAVCPHCQPDETTLIAAGAHVAPSAVLVLPMTGFVDTTALHRVVAGRHAAEPRGPPDRPPPKAPPASSNRDLLTLIDVLRC